jgi:hypothetical protein
MARLAWIASKVVGNFSLPETVGRGHLNEVTTGLHVKGQSPRGFRL